MHRENTDSPIPVLRVQKITHGRHCTCGACDREDWTNPDLAPCGMHGPGCPRRYQPWGTAGDTIVYDLYEPVGLVRTVR